MGHSFVAYVDESGDEGFSFHKGSSEWFVLSAVVIRAANDLETVKLIDKVCKRAKLTKPLHFTNICHERRLPYVAMVGDSPIRVISILVHKHSVSNSTLTDDDRLYFYATRYLVERISWLCRDAPAEGDRTARIVFSHRHTPYSEMRKYLRLLRDRQTSIHWPSIDLDSITSLPHGKCMGVQIADAVSGSFYCAVRYLAGFCEDRYVRMLRQVLYSYNGKVLSYGVKFIPSCEAMIRQEERMAWVRDLTKIKTAGPGPQDPADAPAAAFSPTVKAT